MRASTNLRLAIMILIATAIVVIIPTHQSIHAVGPWYVAPGGSDSNTCLSAVSPCATINGALGKASPVDTVLVATGTYTGTGMEVVTLNISATLSGGWNSGFTAQTGMSTIDGQGARRGITINISVTTTIERFVVQGGFDSYQGGGLLNLGTSTINNSIVRGNDGQTEGGGIYNSGELTVTNTILHGNHGGYGGGIANKNGTVVVNNSSVSSNIILANLWGSGIYNWGGNLTLNNSTVSDNSGGEQSIFNVGTLTLNNSTVSGNMGGDGGYSTGGIYNYFGGIVILQNSILAGNMSGFLGGAFPDCGGQPISSLGYNLIGSTDHCDFSATTGDLLNVEAKLDLLQNNGGPTPTRALLPGSPAINSGNPAGCMGSAGPLTTDQRGFPRFGRCDIGAYEIQPIEYSMKTVNTSTGLPGTPLTYTIVLTNGGAIAIANIFVTDTLPLNLTYHSNSLGATGGTYGFNSGVITWTGSLNAGNRVTLTFGATVSQAVSLGTPIVNTAIISSGGGEILNRTAAFKVDGQVCNLTKYAANPVLTVGANGAWDDASIWRPTVLKEGSTYKMWYSASDGTTRRIGYATSPDGIHWTKYGGNPVLVPGSWETVGVYAPSVIYDGVYKMWYRGSTSDGIGLIGYATSPDGITWTKYGSYVLYPGFGGSWEDDDVAEPNIIKVGSTYHLWYVGNDGVTLRIGHATSTDGINWVKDAANPVLDLGDSGSWDWLDVYGPSVVKVGDEYKLWYSGGTLPAAYQTGYATSLNGSTWTRQQKLIAQGTPNAFDVYSADYPAVVVDGIGYKIWYSGINTSGIYNIGYATAGVCNANPPVTISNHVYLPIIIKSPSCQAYYADSFSDPNSGWPIGEDSNRRFAYTNGQYQIQVKHQYDSGYLTPGAKAVDFTASVTARRASGSFGAYGILFGIDENWSQLYEVLIDANYYSVWRYNSGWTALKDWTTSNAIATGTNWNRLKVVRSGATILFYVNNQLLTSVSDNSFTGLRRIGLAAESDNTALDARFDDFSLYPASCGSSAYVMTSELNQFEMGKPEIHEMPVRPRLP